MSSGPPRNVVDTVVLRYFSLADEFDLLIELLGSPLGVPRIVFDPDEGGPVPDEARSEITRSVQYQLAASKDPARDAPARCTAAQNVKRLGLVAKAYTASRLAVLDLTVLELQTVSRLTSSTGSRAFGLKFPLGPGEAACLAMAVARGLVLATDDADTLRALSVLAPSHPYERIRRLLVRAAEQGLLSEEAANKVHRTMRRLGFWDTQDPFPEH